MSSDHNWYDVIVKNEDKDIIMERIIKLEKRIEELEKDNVSLRDILKEQSNEMKSIVTEHLKTMNKLLETEVSLERTKNILLRNHIPFSFSSSSIFKKPL